MKKLDGFYIIINKESLYSQASGNNIIKCKCGNSIIMYIYSNKQIVGVCNKCGMFPIYLEE